MNRLLKVKTSQGPQYIDAGKLVSTSPFIHAALDNSEYLLMMGLEETVHLSVDGQPVDLQPREVCIIPPHVQHRGTAPSPRVTYYWCHFSLQGEEEGLLGQSVDEFCTLMQLQLVPSPEDILLLPPHFAPSHPSRMIVLLQQILDAQERNCCTQGVITHLLGALLHEVTQQVIEMVYAQQSKKNSLRFCEISEWIRIHAFQHITTREVAQRFHYNPNYISTLFRKKTGYSLVQYMINTKMQVAKELLVSSDKPIKEIADALAFHDPRYFMRCFKKHEGLTPTEYRNANAGIVMNTRWLPKLLGGSRGEE